MIAEITGEILYDRIGRQSVLMRVDSFCYEVLVPSGVASRLRQEQTGERVNPRTLFTIAYIDGDMRGGRLTPRLIGFLDPLDREFFQAFVTVPGVGFMKALRCLVRPLNEISLAIESGDTQFLQELPHIGAKTAERIVTELRGKMAKFALARKDEPLSLERESPSELKAESLEVLLQLEYSRGEALRLVEEIFSQHKGVKTAEEFLRTVFERLHPKTE